VDAIERLVADGSSPKRTSARSPLHVLKALREIAVTYVYAFGLEDYAALARALPETRGHCLEPYFAAYWAGTCKRCGTARVALTAPPPRTPRVVCPECGKRRLTEHVARWYAHVGH